MADLMKLIDAEKLIEKAYWHGDTPSYEKPYAEGHDAVDVEDIENFPTIDAVPVVYGHWEECGAKMVCSACKVRVCAWGADCTLKYCPNCGAKMDEEDYEQDEMGRN